MIREEALIKAAEALHNAKGGKPAIAKAQANLLGISQQTLFRHLKSKGLYQCDRKKCTEKGYGNIFHGVPLLLMVDNSGAHRDRGLSAFLDAHGRAS